MPNVGFLVRSAAALTARWTTVHWIAAAARQGWRCWVFDMRDVTVHRGQLVANGSRVAGEVDPEAVARGLNLRTLPRDRIRVDALDRLLLRTAPLELGVLALAAELERRGVTVINAPAGVLAVAHKSWLAAQELPTPPTLVTRSLGDAHLFHREHGAIVLKPDRGSGGRGVRLVDADDEEGLDQAFTTLRTPREPVVLQRRVRDPRGERRLLWCRGEVIGGYVRKPAEGEFRHNMGQGATAGALALGDVDRALGPLLDPLLTPLGVAFAGLDVLGGMLLEVNAVNPGGTVWADALSGTRLADDVVRRLLEEPEPG